MSRDPKIWVTAIMTLMIYSYLWKENPVYRLAEHTFLGLSVAHGIVLTWDTAILPRLHNDIIAQGKWQFVLFGLIGLLMYTRLTSVKWSWLSRYPISLTVGYGVGYTLAVSPRPWLVQVRGSFRNLWVVRNGAFQAQATFDEWVFFICLMTTLSYFFFTVARDLKFVKGSSLVGRYVIMVALGAAFGNTVQGRISLFLGRLQFLLIDWLGFVV